MRLIRLVSLFFLITISSCNSVFFHPVKDQIVDPDQLGLKYQPITIDDGKGPKLHAWFLPAKAEPLGTILHLHGNAENISTHVGSVYWLPSENYNVLLVDYRGYGNSEGSPTIEGVHEDAKRAAIYLDTKLPQAKRPFFLFGQSLGAAIALNISSDSEMKKIFSAVIVESPFLSYRQIVRDKLSEFWLTKLIKYPLAWTISNDYDPIKHVKQISTLPILFIHPEEDQMISKDHSKKLYEEAAEPKELWLIKGCDHIQTFQQVENRKRLIEYFNQISNAKPLVSN